MHGRSRTYLLRTAPCLAACRSSLPCVWDVYVLTWPGRAVHGRVTWSRTTEPCMHACTIGEIGWSILHRLSYIYNNTKSQQKRPGRLDLQARCGGTGGSSRWRRATRSDRRLVRRGLLSQLVDVHHTFTPEVQDVVRNGLMAAYSDAFPLYFSS